MDSRRQERALSDDHNPGRFRSLRFPNPHQVDPRGDRSATVVPGIPGELVNPGAEDAAGKQADLTTGRIMDRDLDGLAASGLKPDRRRA